MSQSFRADRRGVSQLAAVGIMLGTALVLAVAVGIFMLAGPAP